MSSKDFYSGVPVPPGITMSIRTDSKLWTELGKEFRRVDNEYKRNVLKTWAIYVDLFGSDVHLLEKDGMIVSVGATRCTQRARKDGWGRYINCYVVYTRPEFRRLGYATMLQRWIEQRSLANDYQRVKSLIQTYAGFRFHQALGHQFWGVNVRNEIRVDAPIGAHLAFPATIPKRVRDCVNPHLLNQDELTAILRLPPYNTSEETIAEGFAARPLAYRESLVIGVG